MKNIRWTAMATASALLAISLSAAPAAQAALARTYPNGRCLAPTVPLYGGSMWDTTVGVPPQAWLGIANWGSNTQNSFKGGPGTAYNNDDGVTISAAEGEGTPIMGFVATNGGTGAKGYTLADIETQITDWHTWYGITSFFFGQVPTTTTYQAFYVTLKNWVHANIGSSSRIWLDMGAYPASSSWMNDAAVIMDWENGSQPSPPPAWVFNYKPDRFAMIMNAVPDTSSDIAAAVSDMTTSHAGHGFVTSDPAYQTLPTWEYWTTFANDAATYCR